MNAIYITVYALLMGPLLVLADSQSDNPMTVYLGGRFNYYTRKTRQLALLLVRRVSRFM